MPFLIADFMVLMLLFMWPSLSLFLPNLMN